MSSYVIATSGALATASSDLAGLQETIGAAYAAAAPSTTSVVAAAQDEVSAAIAKLFGSYGAEFQALSSAAGQFHSSFVQALSSGGHLYAAAEAVNANRGREPDGHFESRRLDDGRHVVLALSCDILHLYSARHTRAVRQRRQRRQRRGRDRREWW